MLFVSKQNIGFVIFLGGLKSPGRGGRGGDRGGGRGGMRGRGGGCGGGRGNYVVTF